MKIKIKQVPVLLMVSYANTENWHNVRNLLKA